MTNEIKNISSSNRTAAWAADELQRYLGMTDASIPPVTVGLRSDFPESDESLLPPPAEGYDGYAVYASDDRIIIAGDNERGTVYGVYDLLERLGFRWFYPQQDEKDEEVVPRKAVELQPGSWAVASPIKYRICNASSFFFDIDPDVMIKQLDAAMKARYNGIGWQCDHRTPVEDQYRELVETGVMEEIKKRGMLFHGPAHSFPHFLKNEHFEKHPEWFGMRDGKRVPQVIGGSQFCWSNAEAREEFIRNAERFVLDSPGLDIFCTLGWDGGPCCECPECAKTTPADLVVSLLSELAKRLDCSAPNVTVEMSGGYSPVVEPPDNTRPYEKLRVIWAHWGRYHGYGYDDERYGRRENLQTWMKAFPGRLTLCQYYTDNFATPWVSAPYPIILEGDRRYILQHGITGVYMLVYPKGYWWNHAFNNYMAGVCYYDFSRDPWQMIRDYALHYYGPDAGPLLADYYTEWAREVDLAYHVRDGSSEEERRLLAEQRKKWIDPAVEAVKDDPVLSHRVGKVEKLHRAAEILTRVHETKDLFQRLMEEGKHKEAREALEEAKVRADRAIAYMAEIADLNQGLVDKNEVPGFMTLGIRKWIDEGETAFNTKTRKGESTKRNRGI